MASPKFDVGSLDLDISTEPVFVPNMVSKDHAPLMFRSVPESVKIHARNLRDAGWKFYPVKQVRGCCYYREKVITIPAWAIEKETQKLGYKTWYISHEISHAYAGYHAHHGPDFMKKLIEICPPEFVHYELGYKPRNAAAAGIGQIGILELDL